MAVTYLKMAISLFGTYAKYTTATWDDDLYALMKGISEDSSFMALLEQILTHESVLTTSEGARTQAIQALVANAGPEVKKNPLWDSFVEYAPMLIRLLLTLAGKR